ncbi:hypothetical protein [Roseovarius aestuariivivens]|uniref:hypothetical protein n=1 Tax=Roseovarius aestuariivivens TaxID=1888910 RepID=UPI001081881B|nr:hypothetical protein [Roseovarius aestuariivivens]
MRIIQNTPERLVAEEVPWLIAVMLFLFTMTFLGVGLAIAASGVPAGLLFAGAGGGLGCAALGVFVERLQLVLDARTGRAVIRRRTLWQRSETVLPLQRVLHATEERGPGARRLSRPALVLAAPRIPGASDPSRETVHPVTEIYASGRAAARLVCAVNEWLDERGARSASPAISRTRPA